MNQFFCHARSRTSSIEGSCCVAITKYGSFIEGATVADLLQVNAVLPSLMEYMDGTLVEKTGGTLHHGLVQGNLSIE